MDRLSGEMSSLSINFKNEIHQLKSDITESIIKTLRHEVFNFFPEGLQSGTNAESLGSKRSSAIGIEQTDLKLIIDKLIEKMSYEEAFTKALGSGDLQLVTRICSKVDPKDVLSSGDNDEDQSHILSQPVILSLVQQLVHNVADNSSLKLQWIQESLLALDIHSPAIADYLPHILRQVIQSLESTIHSTQTKLSSSQLRQYKLVLHLAKSILSN